MTRPLPATHALVQVDEQWRFLRVIAVGTADDVLTRQVTWSRDPGGSTSVVTEVFDNHPTTQRRAALKEEDVD